MRRYKSAVFQVEGHTDKRGSLAYNQKLGSKRAQAVRQFFIDQGIEPERVQIVSFGEERPVSGCDQESCWQKNRRAQTRLVINEALQNEIGSEIDREYGAEAAPAGQASLASCGLVASLSFVADNGVLRDESPMLCDATEALAEELGLRWGVWTQGLISFGVVQSDENSVEMDLDGHNLTFGMDYRFPNDMVVGVAVGAGRNDLTGDDKTESRTTQFVSSFYLAKPLDDSWTVNLSAGQVFSEIESKRPDADSGAVMSGARDGLSTFANVELVKSQQLEERSLDLSAAFTATQTRLQAYRETGPLALAFRAQTVDTQLLAAAGTLMFAPRPGKSGVWRGKLTGGFELDVSGDSTAQVNFVNVPAETDYLVISKNEEPLSLSVGGGLDWAGPSGSTLQLGYAYRQNAGLSQIHSFSATYRKPF